MVLPIFLNGLRMPTVGWSCCLPQEAKAMAPRSWFRASAERENHRGHRRMNDFAALGAVVVAADAATAIALKRARETIHSFLASRAVSCRVPEGDTEGVVYRRSTGVVQQMGSIFALLRHRIRRKAKTATRTL